MQQASVLRVRDALIAADAPGEIRHLDESARTAKEAAAALGIEVGQIASSLIFMADSEPLLVVASGRHRVDEPLLSELVGGAAITKATADDVRQATGFAIGGVAPLAHPAPITTIIDEDLADYDQVWAAAGHPYCVFPTTFAELVRITGGRPARVAT